jgi:translation initiation factor IF-2
MCPPAVAARGRCSACCLGLERRVSPAAAAAGRPRSPHGNTASGQPQPGGCGYGPQPRAPAPAPGQPRPRPRPQPQAPGPSPSLPRARPPSLKKEEVAPDLYPCSAFCFLPSAPQASPKPAQNEERGAGREGERGAKPELRLGTRSPP